MPKKAKQWVISDFDLTLTKSHTFQTRRFEYFADFKPNEIFNYGFQDSLNFKKNNIPTQLFNFNNDNLLSIATYHNNPDYIAGFMSGILGKRIDVNGVIYTHYYNKPGPSIKAYKVEGTDKSLLISYLDAQSGYFNALINSLNGKDEQLFHLAQVAGWLELVDAKTHCDFFEDTEKNYHIATQFKDLPNFNAHLVSNETPEFVVISKQAKFQQAMHRAKLNAEQNSEEKVQSEDAVLTSSLESLAIKDKPKQPSKATEKNASSNNALGFFADSKGDSSKADKAASSSPKL